MKIPQLKFPAVHQKTCSRLLFLALSGEERSRSEWAEQTNVGLTTVGRVAQELLRTGLIEERVCLSFSSGRKKGLLRTAVQCRFLVASVDERGCALTVTDGWGQASEQIRVTPNEDLTEGENMLLYREAIARWKRRLEETYPFVGSVLTLPEAKIHDTSRNHFFPSWDVDLVISQEDCVREMILGRYRERTVYYLSLDSDLYPVLWVRGREIPCVPLFIRDFKSRETQLQKVVKSWNAMGEILPDLTMILWAKEPSPRDEELLRERLLAKASDRVTYCTDPEMQGALYCLKKNMAERISSGT